MQLPACMKPSKLALQPIGLVVAVVLTLLVCVSRRRSCRELSRLIDDQRNFVLSAVNTSSRNISTDLAQLCQLLSEQRDQALSMDRWYPSSIDVTEVIRGNSSKLLQQLSKYGNVRTAYLPWRTNSQFNPATWNSLTDTSNVLIQKYYKYTGNDGLCAHLNSHAGYPHCETDINAALTPSALETSFVKWQSLHAPDESVGVEQFVTLYVHVITDSVLTLSGDVISGNFKYVPYGCQVDLSLKVPSHIDSLPIYDEVFVVTQYWGEGVFHEFIEVLPRVASFLEFLHRHQNVKILIPERGHRLRPLMKLLMLDESRFISGVVRARVAYIPPATRCGRASLQQIQIMSSIYRKQIRQKFGNAVRNRLLLIRRSGSRKFLHQSSIEAVVEAAAADYNLTYTLFIDNPVPSLDETMQLFSTALMVVAPHGAGLSNMVFSEPDTFIIEGVCNPEAEVNICFLHLAHVLGHRYHGILAGRGCFEVVNVSASDVDRSVRQHLSIVLK